MMKASIAPVLLALLAGGSLGCEPSTGSQNDVGGGGSGGACIPEDDGNPCTEDVCEGGAPTHEPTVAGTALPDQVTGDCQQAVCDGNGAVTQQNDDADLPDDMNACTDDACSAGAPSNSPIAAGAACGQGLVCDGNGMCVGCHTPADCAGTDDACKVRTCEDGVCGVSFTPANTPAGTQIPGDCSAIVCDGEGDTTTIADDADLPPDDADPCKVPACSAGQPAVADAPNGTACADGDACTQTDTCQAGTCVGADPRVCAVNETCTAGACVCPSGTYTPVLTTVAMASQNGDTEVADLDGDGKLDLITVESTPGGNGNVSVRLGLGDGTFGPLVQYAVARSYGVTAADVNRDGKPDIALVGAQTNNVHVMLNQGDGTLAAAVGYPTNAFPYYIAAADVNNDGAVDLAVAYLSDDNVSVFLNQGDGTFAEKVDYLIPGLGGSDGLTAGDLNADGTPDLVFSRDSAANVLLNQGDGTFGAATSYPVGPGIRVVDIADLNDDGSLDLAAAYFSGSTSGVSVLLNQGDGSFAAAVDHAVILGAIGIAAGDIDGDGDPDLAVASPSTNTLSVYLNPGDASFGAPTTYFMAKGAYGMTAGDLNADGRSDFLIGGSDPVQVYLSTCAP
ncbi:FG-GAP repeat domain-containing protein [Sorangium sp. KYC3313]|uniref:FG-GAP repeat domain-containing protein n=1 Tax=Sorangium sp. KYC3313 TaxID=3449740 RepID=UPI003F8C3019